MYDTARRVALVKQRVRENTRRRQRREAISLSAFCLMLFTALAGAADALIVRGQTAAWGVFGAMLLREDAGGYVLVAVVSFAAAAAITALCFRLKNRENQKKGDFQAIYYMNDEMALGGLQAVEAAGRMGEFQIISVDGEKEALDAVRAGKINYEVMFKPDEQAVAVEVAYKLAKGESVDYSNIQYKGTPIEVTETDDGFTWLRPTCYKIDSTNCNEPEFQGW